MGVLCRMGAGARPIGAEKGSTDARPGITSGPRIAARPKQAGPGPQSRRQGARRRDASLAGEEPPTRRTRAGRPVKQLSDPRPRTGAGVGAAKPGSAGFLRRVERYERSAVPAGCGAPRRPAGAGPTGRPQSPLKARRPEERGNAGSKRRAGKQGRQDADHHLQRPR